MSKVLKVGDKVKCIEKNYNDWCIGEMTITRINDSLTTFKYPMYICQHDTLGTGAFNVVEIELISSKEDYWIVDSEGNAHGSFPSEEAALIFLNEKTTYHDYNGKNSDCDIYLCKQIRQIKTQRTWH